MCVFVCAYVCTCVYFFSYSANILKKDMHPTNLPPDIGK